MDGRCVYCDGPVDPDRDYRRMVGWARDRGAAGGVNALRVREACPEWACSGCVDKLAEGITPNQTAMI